MSKLWRIIFFSTALLWPIHSEAAGVCTTVSVDSSSAGEQILDTISGGVAVQVAEDAVTSVCFMRVDGNCATQLTAGHGTCFAASKGWEFLLSDRWQGQVCGILKSGSTAVNVEVCSW